MSEQPAAAPGLGSPDALRANIQAASNDPAKRLEELERLAAAVAYHDDQATRHQSASKTAKAAIMILHQQRGKSVELEDGTKITWKNPSRSFDAAAFQEAYPVEANDYLYETKRVLDVAAIPPKLKDQFMKDGTGDGSIIIK